MKKMGKNADPVLELEEKLREAERTQDWFEAIGLSAVQLERCGYLAVKECLESMKLDPKLVKKILKKKHLPEIAEYLLSIGKIDSKELETMKKINDERNKLAHCKRGNGYPIEPRATEACSHLVHEAIRILKEKLDATRLVADTN